MTRAGVGEALGKSLIVLVFASFAVLHVASIYNMMTSTGLSLALVSRTFSLAFVVLVIYLTITRLPPKDSAAGIEPRVSAIGGTFILNLLAILPTGSVGPELRLLSTLLIVVGTLLATYCLYWLGRSFSIMATSRKLVTHGPYAVVRHPLYLAESLAVVGIIISNWSLSAFLTGTVQFALQFRRMYNEERVLRRSFAEYDDYADRTPFIVPRLWRKS